MALGLHANTWQQLLSKRQQRQHQPTLLVGICGPSASGKSQLSDLLLKQNPSIACIAQDGYYHPSEQVADLPYRHDNPDSINFAALAASLRGVSQGQPVSVPVYDYVDHCVGGYTTLQPAPTVIVEGHLILANAELQELLDVSVWIDAHPDIRYARRLRRDVAERGRDEADVKWRFWDEAIPAHNAYMAACAEGCDVQIDNHEDHQLTHTAQALEQLFAALLQTP